MTDKSDLQQRRDRLRFRSWHRGTREMDLLLGRFADAHMDALSLDHLLQYEEMLEQSDPDLYNWIIGKEVVPAADNNDVIRMICTHYAVKN